MMSPCSLLLSLWCHKYRIETQEKYLDIDLNLSCKIMIQIKHKAQFQHSFTTSNITKAGNLGGKAALEVMLI